MARNVERGSGFKTPMTYNPRDVAKQKPAPTDEDRLREELGLDDDEDDCADYDADDDIGSTKSGSSARSSATNDALEARLAVERRKNEKSQKDITQRMKRYESERNSLRQELEKNKQANRTQIKMLKKGHAQVLADQKKLIQDLQDMVTEGKKGEAVVSLQRLVDQISSLHKEKNSLIEDNVDLQQKNQEAQQDMQQERIHLNGRMEKLKVQLESQQAQLPSLTNAAPAENSDHAETVARLEAEVSQLQASLKTQRQHHQQQQPVKTAPDPEVQRQLAEERDANRRLQERLKESERQRQSKAIDADKGLQSKMDEAIAGRAQLQKQLQTAQQDSERSRKELSDLEKKVRQLEAIRSELEDQSRERGKHQGSIEQELNKTRMEKKLLEEQVSSVNRESEQLQAMISDLEKSEKDLQEDRRQLQVQLVDHRKTTASLSEARQDIARHEKQVAQLQGAVRKKEEEFVQATDAARVEKQQAVANMEKKIRGEMSGVQQRMKAMVQVVGSIQRELSEIKLAKHTIKKEVLALQQAVGPGIKQMRKQIVAAITEIDTTNKELVRKYRKEMALRKKYHNEIVELKGNIRVFARVRPTIKEDGSGAQAEHVVSYDDDDDGLLSVAHRGALRTFEMDRVFQPVSTQQNVFDEVKALIVSCVDGFNVCIFAYGQTGSGKTFTMEGNQANPGLNRRALQELFTVTADRGKDWDYSITVSVMEIYNESIRDLLSDSPTESKEVKQSRNAADGHYVPGLTWIRVQTVEDVHEVFALGKENRATAVTDMNEHSSRSHALLSIIAVGTNRTTGLKTIGRLNLVDLAGSERINKSGSEGQRLKEAQNINKSLSALGDVIHSLKSKSGHIPYRNSKLTYLLQDSLGGESKTLMMVQVSPVEKNSSETLCTLNFAQRVKSVELGQASRRTETSDTAARERLAEQGGGVSLSGRGSPASSKRTGLAAKKR